jgi:hypothetical protein
MAAFPSTSGALSFALDLQKATADTPTKLRIGMAAGEPIDQDGDLYGAVVHQATASPIKPRPARSWSPIRCGSWLSEKASPSNLPGRPR